MGRFESKKQLTGPWRNIHGAIWLIGLAILFWGGWIWPGILVLIAFSTIIEVVVMKLVPDSTHEELSDETKKAASNPTLTQTKDSDPGTHPELLPASCPRCGAPVRGHDVKWTSPFSADCIFCGAVLPNKNDK